MSSDQIDTDFNSKYTPVTPDGTHIEWDDNDASLPGILDAVDKYCIENNYFQDFFQHRVVPLSKGMIAVDDIMVLKFRTGVHSDPTVHNISNPAPPTPARVKALEDTGVTFDKTAFTKHEARNAVEAPHEIRNCDSKVLQMLRPVVRKSKRVNRLITNAKGSGTALLTVLHDLGEKASPQAKTLVKMELSSHIGAGIKGAITMPSWNAFHTGYLKHRLNQFPKPTDADELSIRLHVLSP